MVPIALRYLFQGDLTSTVDPILSEIEQRLAWRTQKHLPLVDRIYKVGNALLGLKETEFTGKPSTGDINDRLQALINHLLQPMEEEWLKGVQSGSVINRVKELRKLIVPDMIHDVEDQDHHSPLSTEELNRRWRQLEDMSFAQALSLFPRDYIASRPSTDRILETVERIAENLSGNEQAHGPMKAIIQVGDPFPVSPKRDRSADGDPVMKQLEDQLSSMLADLSSESAVYSGGNSVKQLNGRNAGVGSSSGGSSPAVALLCLYVGYAMFMVLRTIPTVPSNLILDDASLQIDEESWGKILAVGTMGAVLGKFIGGFAADLMGGRLTFFFGLVVTSIGVALFAMSRSVAMFQAAFFLALMAKSAGGRR